MKSLRWALAILLVTGAVGLVVIATIPEEPAPPVHTEGGSTLDFSNSETCRECHPEVFEEWESSYHAMAFLDPLVRAKEQSNNFREVGCIPCHAPAPILESAIGKGARVYERFSFREDGIDCLSCHKIGDHVAGTRTIAVAQAACAPILHEQLGKPALCAPCHNQHETVDEWEATEYARQGTDCNDCHMPAVERNLADGSTRPGRSHRFLGAHDRGMLQRGIEMSHTIERAPDGTATLAVSLTNEGTGHNYPSDARHRALDLVVTLIQEDDVELPPRDSRTAGRERGTERRRFRNPYRQEPERLTNTELFGRPNTQIRAGETQTMRVPFASDRVTRAHIELIFKLTPLQSDSEGILVHESWVEL